MMGNSNVRKIKIIINIKLLKTHTCSCQQHIVLEERVGRSLYPTHADERCVETDVDRAAAERLIPVVVGIRQQPF